MHDVNEAATAMLDVRGVHPWDETWHDAFNEFHRVAKEHGSFSRGITAALDLLKIRNAALRLKAGWTFWYNLRPWSVLVWIIIWTAIAITVGGIIAGFVGGIIAAFQDSPITWMAPLQFLFVVLVVVGGICLGFHIGDRLAARHLERK